MTQTQPMIPPYRHILAAVEIHESGNEVLRRARDLARTFGAKLSVLHVVEYLPVDPAGDALLTAPIDLSRERAQQAEARIREWCQALEIPPDNIQVAVGSVTTEILRIAHETAPHGRIDLVVVGHHPRRGLSALFSHTEEGVMQRAACDVLALYLR